jgi:hypothetical protein
VKVGVLGAGSPAAGELVRGLVAIGVGATLMRYPNLPGTPLRVRKIGDALERVPGAWLALEAKRPDLAHAASPAEGIAAADWARRRERPVVLTLPFVVRREQVAGRRLRLATLVRAAEGAAAVVAPSRVARDALWRWLAVEAHVIPGGLSLEPDTAPPGTVAVLEPSPDAFGVAAMRALAGGAVVVAARGSADAEVGDQETARAADFSDARDVARAVAEARELARAPGAAAACRRRAAEFGALACARSHAALYRELIR